MITFPGGGFFGGATPAPAPAPVPIPQPVKPTKTKADEEAAAKKKQREAMGAQATSGRASTLLSEIGTGEKLGA